MFTATLGGLIKDYRIKKRLSQVDISLKIGWKDTSRISKIEQGRVGKPNRQTAEKLIKALDLTEQERGNFLLVGGYLPTETEVENVISELKHKIDDWAYPAYLMDFSFRCLFVNNNLLTAIDYPQNKKDWIKQNQPNFLSFPFLPKDQLPIEVFKGENKESLKPFHIAQIAAFKTENEPYQNESWYKSLVKDLMIYDGFREYWPKVDQTDYHKKLFDYEYKTINILRKENNIILNFHISTGKFINDPRFQLVFYFPADKNTEEYFVK